MSQARLRGSLAGMITLVVFAGLLFLLRPIGQDSLGQPKQAQQPRVRAPEKAVSMTGNLVQLRLTFGVKENQPKQWDGQIHLSEGKIRSVEIMQGNAKGKINGVKWMVRSVKKMKKKKQITRPILEVAVEAPLTAKATVQTAQGNFQFALGDIPDNGSKFFLNGKARVDRQSGAVRFDRPQTEDDYPALAKAADGTIWLAYNEYMPGADLIKERVLAGNFELLVPSGNGDQVRLKRFDGKTWHESIAVTEPGLNTWRPTVSVDNKGRVVVAWSQQVNDNWDVYCRRYTPGKNGGKGEWSKVVRLTEDPGSDFHVVSSTNANGAVVLAWQAWRGGQFQIMAAALADKGNQWPIFKNKVISTSKTNNWAPATVSDSNGNSYIAWDAYDGDSYNIHLATLNPKKDGIARQDIAKSARFEARPSLVCDAQNRLWIAYEEGDEQWGKDYATAQVLKINDVPSNPGRALYLNRTIKVKCLVDGKLMQPAGDIEKAMAKTLPRNKNLPRLAADSAGGVWLWLRHHPTAGGAGEVWTSFALRYNGERWSEPLRIANSENLMDNRPAVIGYKTGILEIHSGDNRQRGAQRKQNDLYAMLLEPAGDTLKQAKLVADTPVTKRNLKSVHPKEKEHVARIRNYRINHDGKKLRLFRGEFHRHTEYTAHRDQDGLLEDSWRYALDAGNMDWMGNGDHDNGFGYEYPWWQIQKMSDLFNHPPVFQAALTHERSNKFPNGHRNVILPKRGIRPLPRGNLKGTAEKGTPDTKMLYAYLKRFGGICASHTSGTNMGTDWRDNDPVVEPIVEIYQGHRHSYEHFGAPRSPNKQKQIGGYQPSGFVWNAFGKGYRMGFQASSDHVSTHMSYAVALTDDVTRKGLIAAFKRRHCYAATDNIIMDVRSGKQLMGDIFETNQRPQMQIKVIGTAPITKLHVVRNNEYVYSIKPMKNEVNKVFTDMQPQAGKENYYYVRVEQGDGNIAWASPMWITYRPKN